MTIEERLAAAERRIAELERRLGAPQPAQNWNWWQVPIGDHAQQSGCSCKPGEICGNAACPLRPVVTCVDHTRAAVISTAEMNIWAGVSPKNLARRQQ